MQFDPAALRPASAPVPSSTPGAQQPRQAGAGGSKQIARGARVRHEQFGTGVVLTMEGSGDSAKLTVYFDRVGAKKFVAKFAKLEVL